MSMPGRIDVNEEGPREGFQIEKGPIFTADKVRFIEALAETGLHDVQCVSFVDPRRVPGMADSAEVARLIKRRDGVRYTGIFLNQRGLERALESGIDIRAGVQVSASEAFSVSNTNKDTAETLAEQRTALALYAERGLRLESAIVMTAFGCNFSGVVTPERVVECVAMLIDVAAEAGQAIPLVRLADTVGWANPVGVARVVGAVRDRWPGLRLGLHLHDTRGLGLANALAGLQLGIDSFDSSCGGLGGCPFAGHGEAAGNICTEDLVFLCHEMGIETGVDLERLIECGRMAEAIIGHRLPGKLLRTGSLNALRGS